MTTVTWVRNASLEYEISSRDHLVQLMNDGTLYANAGDTPSDFFTSKYRQTTDIDLLGDDTNIKPIGVGRVNTDYWHLFSGEYDGGSYTISNWSYTDPNYESGVGCEPVVGLFNTESPAVLRNIRMAGVCTLRGFDLFGGMCAGNAYNATVENIECDFSPGSLISQGPVDRDISGAGGVFGAVSTCYGITLRGELDIEGSSNLPRIGGIVGSLYGTMTMARNLASFPNDIRGVMVGGIAGYTSGSLENCIVAITGDISSTSRHARVGGVGGWVNGETYTYKNLINSMKGNINVQREAYGGGVIGVCPYLNTRLTYDTLINYMSGDIIDEWSNRRTGGITGHADLGTTINTSINAMNGHVDTAVIGTTDSPSTNFDCVLDTTFGLTFDTNTHGTTRTVNSLPGLPVSPGNGLPYVVLSGTDTGGVTHDFEFVFGNIFVSLNPRPVNIVANIKEVEGASAYRVTVQVTGSDKVRVVADGFTGTKLNIQPLVPLTGYTVKQYYTTDGTLYQPSLEESTTTTDATSSRNFVIGDFKDTSGVFDLSGLNTGASGQLYEVINEILTTGDSVKLNLSGKSTKTARFIKRGESHPIVDALVMPFETSGGTSQTASITLSDESEVTLTFDEVSETINVGGVSYSYGDSTVIDGKKMTIVDI